MQLPYNRREMELLLSRVHAWLRAVYRAVTARRYRAMATFLHHNAPPPDNRRGLVLLQVDGLSYSHLREAMARGVMPTLRHLVTVEGWHALPWLCGLPSSTPSSQAGIMYGNRWDIPSFRWYEKESHLSVDAKVPGIASRLNERLAQGRAGLLSGGASYSNIFDGGAELTFMTFSAFSRQHFFANVRGMDMLLLFLLNPLRVLRVAGSSLWDFVQDVAHQVAERFRPGNDPPFTIISPFAKTLIGIVLQEIQTFGVRVDMHVGRPAVCANYLGYDKLAHRYGPLHDKALRSLQRIDRHIAEIIRTQRESASRPYTVIILSDHGQSPSVSFRERYGMTLGEFIRAQLQSDGLLLDETMERDAVPVVDKALLMDELEGVEANLSARARRVVRLFRHHIEQELPPPGPPTWHLERHGDVVVRSSGPLSHIYFNVTPRQMNLSEVLALYPTLVQKLANHPGIGLVLGREEGEPVIADGQGTHRFSDNGLLGPGARKAGLGATRYVAEQLRRMVQYPHSGDLIVLGAWNAAGECVAFEDQRGTHGGISGEQDQPFLLLPPDIPKPLPIQDAEALYDYFRSLAMPPSPATERAGAVTQAIAATTQG